MTLKSTDKFKVTVNNSQLIDGEVQSVSEEGMGSIRSKGGVCYIKYDVGGTVVFIKVLDGKVNVKRKGEYGSDTDYIIGKKTSFSYSTPYGVIPMEVFTHKTEHSLTEIGGSIRLEYDICMGADKILNKMEISIKAV